jgi:ABC-2 type transport system ATP-binding protein
MKEKKSQDNLIIEVKKLVKTYNGLKAVDNISFNVKRGEIFAFLGPNGAGKTTTIKILTTLTNPSAGTVRINGYDPVSQENEVRRSFGIVFQDQSLDDQLTAFENMDIHGILYGVPRDLRQKRIEELLKFVELWERRNDLIKKFSGGMRRRLEVARGLLHHPQIFFLDEPTLGLDPQTRTHIWNYIKDLNQKEKTTIFFTTHYMEEAEKVAQRIAVIDHGQIIAIGSAAQLKKQTKTHSLEEAFIALTGYEIREEEVKEIDRGRLMMRARGR